VGKLLWLIYAKYAIEFYTWAPTLPDVGALRYGRILLEAPMGVDLERLEAVPLLDGGKGIALWIPFADAPQAQPLRAWLHALYNRAVALHPDLVSTAINTHHDGCVHRHVQSNVAGHYSAVPYSFRAQGLTVCTPIHWNELGSFASADAFRSDAIPTRLQSAGDVLASEVNVILRQTFGGEPAL
jgi:DNA primase